MNRAVLRRAWCPLRVTLRVVIGGSLGYRTPLLLSCILGSCLDFEILDFLSIPRVVSLVATVVL